MTATQNIEDFDEAELSNAMEEDFAEEEEKKPDVACNRGFAVKSEEGAAKVNLDDWRSSDFGGSSGDNTIADVHVDAADLPLIEREVEMELDEEGKKVKVTKKFLRMYWLDAHEDPFKHPGTVWLFGKVAVQPKKFVSCCVTVKNIPRRIYLAKRETHSKTGEPVSGMDLYNEFNTKVAKRYKISDFKCRPVEMSYAFEHADIPDHGTYLEVLYGPQFPALPADLTGETFCRVFGTPQTSLEMFLLQQKIKGPGWLDISGAVPVSAQVSWCRLEATISNPSQVKVSGCTEDQPPLTIISLKLGTVINAKTQQNEVAMAGVVAHTSYSLSSPPERNF